MIIYFTISYASHMFDHSNFEIISSELRKFSSFFSKYCASEIFVVLCFEEYHANVLYQHWLVCMEYYWLFTVYSAFLFHCSNCMWGFLYTSDISRLQLNLYSGKNMKLQVCQDFFWHVQVMNVIRKMLWLSFFFFWQITKSSLNKQFAVPCLHILWGSYWIEICSFSLFSIFKNLSSLLLWKFSLFSAFFLFLHFYIINLNFYILNCHLIFIYFIYTATFLYCQF